MAGDRRFLVWLRRQTGRKVLGLFNPQLVRNTGFVQLLTQIVQLGQRLGFEHNLLARTG